MAWSNTWGDTLSEVSRDAVQVNPKPANPWDAKSQDEVLMHWQKLKNILAEAKEEEMEFRKYVVGRAFPAPKEGVNTLELGNGYSLKAGIKYNYKLDKDNHKIEDCLDKIAKVGNQGAFIADRLVSWTPNFLVTEYRTLQQEADGGSAEAKQILTLVGEILTIDDAAPSLDIKEPKGKKK